jgi:hypothetical protein
MASVPKIEEIIGLVHVFYMDLHNLRGTLHIIHFLAGDVAWELVSGIQPA